MRRSLLEYSQNYTVHRSPGYYIVYSWIPYWFCVTYLLLSTSVNWTDSLVTSRLCRSWNIFRFRNFKYFCTLLYIPPGLWTCHGPWYEHSWQTEPSGSAPGTWPPRRRQPWRSGTSTLPSGRSRCRTSWSRPVPPPTCSHVEIPQEIES